MMYASYEYNCFGELFARGIERDRIRQRDYFIDSGYRFGCNLIMLTVYSQS